MHGYEYEKMTRRNSGGSFFRLKTEMSLIRKPLFAAWLLTLCG